MLLAITLPFLNHIENKINIQIQRTEGTQPDLKIKDFQLLIQNNDEQHQFILGCAIIIQNTCLECEQGWILQQFEQNQEQTIIFNLSLQQCIPICGDNFIVESEQCDDGNSIPYDGCYNCQYQCVTNCIKCDFGICKQCDTGYELDLNQICQPICGDGLIIPYIEQCDDSSMNSGDGCFECQIECFENCQKCHAAFCIQCSIGFQLISNQCSLQCGDKIVVQGYEECDDGNDEQYDGCYQCKYQCHNQCQLCREGICKDQCNYGDFMVNYKCQSVCGNKIITGYEECDDGNNIQHDGCYLCKYSCPLNCDYCEQGICLECQENYSKQNNQCISVEVCGNGYLGVKEDCDDGNTSPNDGCFNCKVEDNWFCDQSNPTYCFIYDAPSIILTFLNYTLDIQYVRLTFSQQVYIQQNDQQEIIKGEILDIQDDKYNLSIHSIRKITSELSDAEYVIGIKIFQTVSQPILQINLGNNIVNQYLLPLIRTSQQLRLQSQNFLNPQQKQLAQTLNQVNQNIIYSLAGLSFSSLLLGASYIFLDIFYALQCISYLKFINIDFPQNVVLFFQFSDTLSINPLLNFINLNQYLNKIYESDQNSFAPGQFTYYKQETSLVKNLFCQFLQIIIFLIMLAFCQIFKKLLKRNMMVARYIYCISYLSTQLNQNFVLFLSQQVYQLIQTINNCSKMLSKRGLIQILQLNAWDLTFKTFLYLSRIQQGHSYDYFQLSLSCIILFIYLAIIYLQLINIQYFTGHRDQLYKMILELINLVRSMFLQLFIVFCQQNQAFQNISILITNLAYIIVLHFTQNHFRQPKRYVQFIIEIIVVLFTILSIFHFKDFQYYFNPDLKIFIGFVQICILGTSIAAILIDFAIKKGKQLLVFIKKQHIKKERSNKVSANLFI